MHEVAVSLAELVQHGGQVTAEHLDLALSSHASLVTLLRAVHSTTTGLGRQRDRATLDEHPVAVLGTALRKFPVIAPVSLTDVLAAPTVDVTGGRWRSLARNAALSFHEWTTADRASLSRSPEEAWAEIADIAALSEALSIVTLDLARAAAHADRTDVATRLRRGTTGDLLTAARATAQVAALGHLDVVRPDLRPLPQRTVLVVRNPHHVGYALERLELLLNTAVEVTPQQMKVVAAMLAETSDLAAVSLAKHAVHAEATDALGKQAESLRDVAGGSRRLGALARGDWSVVEQATQIYRVVAQAHRDGLTLPEGDAIHVARGTGAGARMVNLTASRMVDSGRWLAPAEHQPAGQPGWDPVRKLSNSPELVRRALVAGYRGRVTLAVLPKDPSPAPNAPPREVLSAVLAQQPAARPAEHRPALPSHPRRPAAPRAR